MPEDVSQAMCEHLYCQKMFLRIFFKKFTQKESFQPLFQAIAVVLRNFKANSSIQMYIGRKGREN